MAEGGFLQSLAIALKLDASDMSAGIQQVAREIDNNLKGAFEGLSPALDGLTEEIARAAAEAEALGETSDFMEGLAEGLQAAAEEAGLLGTEAAETAQGIVEGFMEAAEEAGLLGDAVGETSSAMEDAASAGESAGAQMEQALSEVSDEARDAANTIRHELPAAARQAAAGMSPPLNNVASKFKNFAMQIVGPIAGAFAISGAVSTFMNGAMAAKEAAQQFGVASDELQLWQGAITRAGGNVSKFEMSLRRMATSVKVAGDPLQAMYNLAGQAEKMSRDAFETKAKELGIDTATIGVLYQGRKALDEHLKRAKEIGIYEQRHIEMAEKLKIGLWELNGSFDGLKNELLIMVLPAMSKILQVLTDVTLFVSNHAPFVATAIGVVGAALAIKLLPPLKDLPKYISNIWKGFIRWFPIIAIITAIALVIEDLWGYLTGAESELAEFWAIFGTGPEIMAAVSAAWRDLKAWGTDCIVGLVHWLKSLWATLEKWGVINDIKNAFMGLGHLIHGVLTKNWEEAAAGAKNFCSNLIAAFVHTAMGIGQALYDFIKNAFERLLAWIKEKFSLKNILGGMGELGKELAEAEGWDLEGVDGRAMGEQAAASMSKQKSPEDAKKEFEATWSRAFGDWGDESEASAQSWAASMIDASKTVESSVKAAAAESGDALKSMMDEIEPQAASAGEAVSGVMADTASTVESGFNAAWSSTASVAVSEFQGAASTIQAIFASVIGNIGVSLNGMIAGAQAMAAGGAMVPAFAGVRAANAGGTINNSSSAVNIGTMNVSTRATDANGMARGVKGALNKNRLVQAVQSGVNQK